MSEIYKVIKVMLRKNSRLFTIMECHVIKILALNFQRKSR